MLNANDNDDNGFELELTDEDIMTIARCLRLVQEGVGVGFDDWLDSCYAKVEQLVEQLDEETIRRGGVHGKALVERAEAEEAARREGEGAKKALFRSGTRDLN